MRNGSWRAEIVKRGVRKSKVFPTKTAAKDWAAREEDLIDNAETVAAEGVLSDLFDRYARERSPEKRGARWEQIRLAALSKDEIGSVKLADLSALDISRWRDRLGTAVKPATVLREMQLLSAVLNVAQKEWLAIPNNPMSDVRRPRKPAARDRLSAIMKWNGWPSLRVRISGTQQRAFHAFRFVIETAMRAGEIVGLTWANIDLSSCVTHRLSACRCAVRSGRLLSQARKSCPEIPVAKPPGPRVTFDSAGQPETRCRESAD